MTADRPDPVLLVPSRDDAIALVALRVLRDEVTRIDSAVRARVEATMLVGDRTTAALPDGTVVGHVQRKRGHTGGTVSAAVTDELELLQWAREHAPHLVTEHVAVPAQKALLAIVKAEGGWPDKRTGEVLPVPGIDVTVSGEGRPTLEVRPAPGAAETVRAAWADGTLTLTGVAQLAAPTAGEEDRG